MQKAKRIFLIADFKEGSPKSIRVSQRMWMKSLLRIGCDVQRFAYRSVMMQASLVRSKRIALKLGKKKADQILLKQLKQYQPDIVFVLSMKYLDDETVFAMRQAAPNAIFAARDEDPFPELNPARLAIAKQCDIVINTSAGRFLKTYKDAGVRLCAFIPNICDPDIQYKYDVDEKYKADIVFTGRAEHSRLDRNNERFDLIKNLRQKQNAKIYDAFGTPGVEGINYFRAISGAKIGLSINIVNDVRLYHSDRLINYISCGTFTLAKRVPDTDLLFEDKVHVKYFDSVDEFFELADYYLKHETERENIAAAGMKRAHEQFNCQRIAEIALKLIETGSCSEPWTEIL
jgi:glycosyltransferase involved in cell wall biosynthesis